eukprot:4475948-Prymnesium_polylepis.1
MRAPLIHPDYVCIFLSETAQRSALPGRALRASLSPARIDEHSTTDREAASTWPKLLRRGQPPPPLLLRRLARSHAVSPL